MGKSVIPTLEEGLAKMSTSLKVGTFTKSILIQIGQETGRFAQTNLAVEEVSVPSSPSQFESLSTGGLDVAITSPDNVIAYRYLSANPLRRKLNVKILGALDRGLGLSLCLSPDYQDVGQIEDLAFAVDVPQSGFAFVGYGLMENQGLSPKDYTIQTMGSTPKRARALIAGECDATILNAGNEIYAVSKGCTKISSVTDLGPYLGTVVAAIPNASALCQPGVTEFAAVLFEIVQDIKDGKLRDEIVRMSAELLGVTSLQAEEHYEVLLNEENGLIRNSKIDRPSVETLIALRRRFLPTDELDSVLESLNDLVLHRDLLLDVTA